MPDRTLARLRVQLGRIHAVEQKRRLAGDDNAEWDAQQAELEDASGQFQAICALKADEIVAALEKVEALKAEAHEEWRYGDKSRDTELLNTLMIRLMTQATIKTGERAAIPDSFVRHFTPDTDRDVYPKPPVRLRASVNEMPVPLTQLLLEWAAAFEHDVLEKAQELVDERLGEFFYGLDNEIREVSSHIQSLLHKRLEAAKGKPCTPPDEASSGS